MLSDSDVEPECAFCMCLKTHPNYPVYFSFNIWKLEMLMIIYQQ